MTYELTKRNHMKPHMKPQKERKKKREREREILVGRRGEDSVSGNIIYTIGIVGSRSDNAWGQC